MPSFPPLIHSTFATNSCPRINSKALQARSSGDTKISPKGSQMSRLSDWWAEVWRVCEKFVGSLGDIHWYSSCFWFQGNETWLKKFHRRFFHGKDPIEDLILEKTIGACTGLLWFTSHWYWKQTCKQQNKRTCADAVMPARNQVQNYIVKFERFIAWSWTSPPNKAWFQRLSCSTWHWWSFRVSQHVCWPGYTWMWPTPKPTIKALNAVWLLTNANISQDLITNVYVSIQNSNWN